METILIKYHDEDILPIEKISVGDWIDLRSAEDVFIEEGDCKVISLGVSMKLPEGYEAHIVPRSSTYKTWGIIQSNSLGVIDNSYSGTNDIWRFSAICLKGKYYDSKGIGTYIKKGDRICQFRIMKKQPELQFISVDALDDVDRGGFGSTGSK